MRTGSQAPHQVLFMENYHHHPSWWYFWLQNGKGRNAELQMQELTSQSSEQCMEPVNSIPKPGPGAPPLTWLFLVRCGETRHSCHGFPGSCHQLWLLSACATGRNGKNRHPLFLADCSGAAGISRWPPEYLLPPCSVQSLHSSIRRWIDYYLLGLGWCGTCIQPRA